MSEKINDKNEFYVVHYRGHPYHIWENKLYKNPKMAQKARPLLGPHAKFWTIRKVKLE